MTEQATPRASDADRVGAGYAAGVHPISGHSDADSHSAGDRMALRKSERDARVALQALFGLF